MSKHAAEPEIIGVQMTQGKSMRIGACVVVCQPVCARFVLIQIYQNQALRKRHDMDAGPLAVQEVN